MKILHIIPNLLKGGAERLVLDICIELQTHDNIHVQLITFSESNEYRELTNKVNHHVVTSRFHPSISGKSSKDVKDLQIYISIFKPDVIHSHLWESEMVLSQIKSDAKWFSHFHDNMSQLRKIKLPFSKKDITDSFEKRMVLKSYSNKNVNFICISKYTMSYAKKVLPKPLLRNINLIHNGIDFDHFYSPVKAIKADLTLINIGSFVKKKNQKLAIEIVAHLIKNEISCELILLGDGPLKVDLIEYARQLNISDQVQFMGNVDNVAKHLSKASVYLHTALSEPFGLVLLEAMAAGLPVVSLDGKGNRDIIKNNINGYIITNQSIESFSRAIINLSKEKELSINIAKKGQRTAKKYDIKNYGKQLLKLYKESIS